MLHRRSLFAVPAAFCAAAFLCVVPAVASAQAPPPQGKSLDLPLLIAPPPGGGHVTLEVDARNDDVLGLVKDLLEGITSESASVKGKPAAAPTAAKPKPVAGAKKTGKPAPAPAPPKPASAQTGSGNEFVDMLQQAGINDVLRPISHLHLLVVKMPSPPVPTPEAGAVVDPVNFYADGFKNEGGRLLVWSDEKNQLLIMGFDAPRKHFAVVSRSGSTITVVRADGYPDVKKLAKLITMFTGD